MLASMAEREKNRRKASMSEEYRRYRERSENEVAISCLASVQGRLATAQAFFMFIVRGRRNSQKGLGNTKTQRHKVFLADFWRFLFFVLVFFVIINKVLPLDKSK